jgi:hypothetical protein
MDVNREVEIDGDVEEITERHALEDTDDERIDEAMEEFISEDSGVSEVTVTRKVSELEELEPGDHFINSAKERFRKTEDGDFEKIDEE